MTQDDKIMDAIDTSRATLDAALQPSGIQSSKSSRVPSSQPPPPSPRPNVVHCHGRVDDWKPWFLRNEPSKILDLCCGQGRHTLHLSKTYPHLQIFGHDQSGYLVSLASDRAKKAKLKNVPTFTVGDCRKIPYPDNHFDFIMVMGNPLVLAPGGRVVLDLTDGGYMREHFVERSWEWVDDSTFVCRERQLSPDKLRLSSREVITLTDRGVVRDQFYQERLYSRGELNLMVEAAGLEVVPVALDLNCGWGSVGEMNVADEVSKRQEDLGMMAHRMIVTAVKPGSSNADGALEASSSAIVKAPGIIDNFKFESLVLLLGTRRNHDKKHFVFNLCDEGYDNDALKELHVPATLEMLRLPYSGAGPNCLAYCYDKGIVNRTAHACWKYCEAGQGHQGKIKYPAFIKPIKGDNSLGITTRSIVNNVDEVTTYMKELNGLGIRDVIIQEYCRGTEYSVGMIGNLATGFHFFPILEVDYTKILERNMAPILGFESKWDPTSPYWSEISYFPAKISEQVATELKNNCIVLWERFGCRDYARFDFRCEFGRGDGFEAPGEKRGLIKLLEVNPNPGWCWDGKFAYMGSFEGKDYKDVLGMILKAAHDRVALEESKAEKGGI
ncbi:S-adenosyl-L-methionine-dependent methyltransferase [Rhizoclosmatium globosum]|uniref:S-adenosyl-L-methionine-dependent methyltransferase n=1 Tax=Rhizoclosmatium globosum TaxID=329046 RepID=A0A1Y2CCU6_9FUNG|nr:S-adenosyl-L-methionine-dependent methyltransferase [Rhizoclosmatium globosum]|eukprot:ORY44727.1 S-adenosyl-L-methionine-dependent methyltransferase [Rhizoclosmatium globosum]